MHPMVAMYMYLLGLWLAASLWLSCHAGFEASEYVPPRSRFNRRQTEQLTGPQEAAIGTFAKIAGPKAKFDVTLKVCLNV